MSPEQASEFYIEHYGKMFFPSLVAYMSSAPVQVYCLAKAKAISSWNQIMGSSNPFKVKKKLFAFIVLTNLVFQYCKSFKLLFLF